MCKKQETVFWIVSILCLIIAGIFIGNHYNFIGTLIGLFGIGANVAAISEKE